MVMVIIVGKAIRKTHVRRMNEHRLVRRRISVGPVLDGHVINRTDAGIEVTEIHVFIRLEA